MAIDNQFGKGIGVAAGFDLGAQKPLDSRVAVNTIAERDAHVTENRAYEGMLVYVAEDNMTYQLVKGEEEGQLVWKEFGFNQDDFDAAFDKAIVEAEGRIDTLEKLVVGGEGEGLNKVIADVAANKTAIEKLNGGVDKEGSVAKAVADEASIREQADNSLAGRIAAFETNGANDVAALAGRVKANEDKLDGLKNATVKAEIEAAQAAAEKHADDAITALVDSAPEAMDTLNELAKAINNNKGIYDAYVTEHNQAMAQQKADLQAEIDADVKVEKERAEGQEAAIRQEMATAIGNYTEGEKQATGLRKEIAEADAAIRQEMAEAVAGVHKHDNKAVLDGIDADKVAAWNGAQAAAEAKAAELDAALKTALQKEIDDDVKVVADALANEKKADVEGTLAKQIADVNARLNQNGDIELKIAQAEADIDGLQGLVGQPARAAEGEGEEGVPATGLHLALDNAKTELSQAIATEKGRAEGQEAAIRQEFAAADAALHTTISKEIDDDVKVVSDALAELIEKVGHEGTNNEFEDPKPATGLVAKILANEAFVAAQPALDKEQDRRLTELEAFKKAIGEESVGLDKRIDALEVSVNGREAAEGVEAVKSMDEKIADAKAAAIADAADKDAALHAAIKGEMAAVIQSLVAEITEDGMLRIALGGIQGDDVLIIREQEIPFVTDAEIDEIIAGLDAVEDDTPDEQE